MTHDALFVLLCSTDGGNIETRKPLSDIVTPLTHYDEVHQDDVQNLH